MSREFAGIVAICITFSVLELAKSSINLFLAINRRMLPDKSFSLVKSSLIPMSRNDLLSRKDSMSISDFPRLAVLPGRYSIISAIATTVEDLCCIG